MKIQSSLFNRIGGFAGAAVVRTWMANLDYRTAYYDPAVDPRHSSPGVRRIYLFWHEYILMPIYLRGHCNVAALLSQHRDSEILSHAAYHLGFECVRGSTRRGGAEAVREMLQRSRHMHLTITPDGPRGPRRVLAPGAIFLASKLELPLVVLGLGYDHPWRLNSWDRFAIPRPFSRARVVFSPELHLPPDLDRAGLEHYRREVRRLLNRLTAEAEAWAESGTHKVQERPFRREHVPGRFRRRDAVHRRHAPHAAMAGARRLASRKL